MLDICESSYNFFLQILVDTAVANNKHYVFVLQNDEYV